MTQKFCKKIFIVIFNISYISSLQVSAVDKLVDSIICS